MTFYLDVESTPNNGLDITQLLVTTQHAVVGDALTDTGRLWFSSLPTVTGDIGHGSPKFDQSDATHTIHTNYSQPVALSACRSTHFTNANKIDHVPFPLLFGVNPPGLANSNNTEAEGFIRHTNLFYSQISQISDYGVDWIELPDEPFKDSSVGAVIKFPSTHPKVPSYQNVITCNIVAAWSPGSLALKTAAGSITEAVTNFENKSSPDANRLPFNYSEVPDAEERVHGLWWPEPINISASWAQYLNPVIDGLNRTVADVLLRGSAPRTESLGSTQKVSALVANGLARTSWDSVLQGDIKIVRSNAGAHAGGFWNGSERVDGNYWLSGRNDVFTVDPRESQDWTTFLVDSTFQGYGYNAYTVPPRIAIAVMVLYCLLVVGHTIYSGTTGNYHTLPVKTH